MTHILYTLPAEYIILGSTILVMFGLTALAALSDFVESRQK
jgi:hypothetical protein